MKTLIPSVLVFAAMLLAPATGSAQAEVAEKGHILAKKGALPAAGFVRTEQVVSDLEDAAMDLVVRGQNRNGRFTYKVRAKVVTEGLAPGKARRTLVSKTVDERVWFNGSERVTPDKGDPLQGLPVIIEYKGDAWTAALEKGEPGPEQKEALKELVGDLRATSGETVVYGEVPRKPGERWNVDPKTIERYAGVHSPQGTVAVEFVKVEEFRGSPCAVLKTTFDLEGASIPKADGKGFKKEAKGEILVRRSLADLTDLQVKVDFNSVGQGTNAEGVDVKIEGAQKEHYETTVEKR